MGMKSFGVGISVKNIMEAVGFYEKIFGLESKNFDYFPEGHECHGECMHAELWKGDVHIFDVMGMEPNKHDFDAKKQIISFGAYFDSEAELLEAFAQLSEGGIVKEPIGSVPWSPCCATVIDKHGITWWISI